MMKERVYFRVTINNAPTYMRYDIEHNGDPVQRGDSIHKHMESVLNKIKSEGHEAEIEYIPYEQYAAGMRRFRINNDQ